MVGLFDFLTPADRQQAAYQGLTGLGMALAQAGGPSTMPGGALRGLGMGLGGFGSAYQNALNSTLAQRVTGLQAAKLARENARDEAWNAAFGLTPTGGPSVQPIQVADASQPGAVSMAARMNAPLANNQIPANSMLAGVPRQMIPFIGALGPEKGSAMLAQLAVKDANADHWQPVMGPDGKPTGLQVNTRTGEQKPISPKLVDVNNNQLGNIPPGYQLTKTPDGGYRMEPIPGSPAAKAEADAAEAKGKKTEQQQRTTDIVTQDIDRALGLLKENPGTVSGMGGSLLSNIPGTNARNFAALVATVKANAGFDRLQAMRDASPTGGALGNVSEPEIAFLQAAIGNLEQSQSPEQLADNLRRVKNVYLDIVHGPGQGPPREKLGFQTQGKGGGNINALREKYGITPTR